MTHKDFNFTIRSIAIGLLVALSLLTASQPLAAYARAFLDDSECAGLSNEVAYYQGQVEKSTQELAEIDNRIDDLTVTDMNLNRNLAAAKKDVADAQNETARAEKRMNPKATEGTLAAWKKAANVELAAKSKLRQIEGDLNINQMKMRDAKNDRTRVQANLQSATQLRDTRAKELDDCKKANEKVRVEREKLNARKQVASAGPAPQDGEVAATDTANATGQAEPKKHKSHKFLKYAILTGTTAAVVATGVVINRDHHTDRRDERDAEIARDRERQRELERQREIEPERRREREREHRQEHHQDR